MPTLPPSLCPFVAFPESGGAAQRRTLLGDGDLATGTTFAISKYRRTAPFSGYGLHRPNHLDAAG
jgi:hypothetical protein